MATRCDAGAIRAPSSYLDAARIADGRVMLDAAAFASARPGGHLVTDGLFDHDLLTAVEREIAVHPGWRTIRDARQDTRRSTDPHRYGPAIETYLAAVNSARFVRYLTALTGLPHLIADVTAERAGPHESVNGSFMAIHRDFSWHRGNDLRNAVLVLTYLTHGWEPGHGGRLELCSDDGRPVRRVDPVFGRTLILANPDRIFHGCPEPFVAPPEIVRRSIATYFYVNPHADGGPRPSSVFYGERRPGRLATLARRWSSPLKRTVRGAIGRPGAPDQPPLSR